MKMERLIREHCILVVLDTFKKGVSFTLTDIQVKYWDLQEKKRSNLANEGETHRANVAREVEQHRSNVANETETARANRAREGETSRHNFATESLELQKIGETRRHNKATESIESYKATETAKHNAGMREIESARLQETTRHNIHSEINDRNRVRAEEERNAITERQNKKANELRDRELTAQYDRMNVDLALGTVNAATRLIDAVLPG